MELAAYLHAEALCEFLEHGESIDQNLDCQFLEVITDSSRHAKSILLIGLAASALTLTAFPATSFADTAISQVQQLLLQRGFNPGVVDGIQGEATTSAIIAAQNFYGLEPDGIAGPQTLAALESDTYVAANESSATPIAATPASSTTSESKTTDCGSDSISNLQQLLTDRGFYKGPIDGIDGWQTRQAVISAQETYGLIADGIAGGLTLAALEADQGTPTVAEADIKPTSTQAFNATVEDAQILLTELSFYDGAIDGIQGPATTTAIKKAQALYGLPVDGILNNQTLSALQS